MSRREPGNGSSTRPPAPSLGGSNIVAAIVESAFDAILSKTLDGNITSWNPAAERLYGYKGEEVVGRHISMLVPDDRRDELDAIFAALQGGERLEPFETVRLSKEGRRLWVSVTISPIHDQDGRIIGASAIQRDFSVIKRARALEVAGATLQEAPTLDAAMPRLLEVLCCELGFDIGEYWRLENDTALLRRTCRFLNGTDESLHSFDAFSDKLTFAPGEALSGLVIEGQVQRGLFDLRDPAVFARAQAAEEAGLRTGLALRLKDKQQEHGSLLLLSRRSLRAETALVETVSRIEQDCNRLIEHRRLEREHDRLAAIVEASHDAVIGWSIDGEITSWNSAATRLYGYEASEILGRSILMLVPEDIRQRWHLRAAEVARGIALEQFETVRQRKDGSRIEVALTVSPIRDASGRVVAAATIGRDISERKRNEAQRELLLAELSHRVKNTLAVVQALAQQTFRETDASAEARKAFEGRLLALAAAHDVLTQAHWEKASLVQLASDALQTGIVRKERVNLAGPPIFLPPKQALAVSMALHELYTNALKYGALSNDSGRIMFEWRVTITGRPHLRLEWRESGGPRVSPPTRRGFGSQLIELGLAQDLEGDVAMNFRPEGLVCTIDAPLPMS